MVCKKRRVLVCGLVSVLLLSGCGNLTQRIEQTEPTAAFVEAQIKRALIDALGVDAAAIKVMVEEEQITLDGFVDSKDKIDTATRAASSVAQGYQLENRLLIRESNTLSSYPISNILYVNT